MDGVQRVRAVKNGTNGPTRRVGMAPMPTASSARVVYVASTFAAPDSWMVPAGLRITHP
jgi:hypothetical protein